MTILEGVEERPHIFANVVFLIGIVACDISEYVTQIFMA